MKPIPNNCPFCNAGEQDLVLDSGDLQTWFVWCMVCDATGPDGKNENEATELWNKRYNKSLYANTNLGADTIKPG